MRGLGLSVVSVVGKVRFDLDFSYSCTQLYILFNPYLCLSISSIILAGDTSSSPHTHSYKIHEEIPKDYRVMGCTKM